MTFTDIARSRYSCRNYKSIPIEQEILLRVLEAGRIAPSAVNYQPWYFVVIQDQGNLTGIHQSYPRDWFRTAPCIIVLCGDHSASWKRKDGKDHCNIDIAIAADHITLAATEAGLATCWVCNSDSAILKNVLELPAHIEPIVMLPIGYPNDQADPDRHTAKRKKFEEVVFFEKVNLK